MVPSSCQGHNRIWRVHATVVSNCWNEKSQPELNLLETRSTTELVGGPCGGFTSSDELNVTYAQGDALVLHSHVELVVLHSLHLRQDTNF